MSNTQEETVIQQTEEMMAFLENGPEWLDILSEAMFSHLIDKIFLTTGRKVRIKMLNGLEVTEPLGNEGS